MSTFDRDKARDVLKRKCPSINERHENDLLDALEGCVRPAPPQGIDRDALVVLLADAFRLDGSVAVGVLTDRILRLVRPVEGITLTRDEAVTVRFALDYTRCGAVLGGRDQAHMRALAARLEALS